MSENTTVGDVTNVQQRAERLAAEMFTGGPVKYFEQIGRLQLEVLLHEGLQPTSKVLDIGCGALRAPHPAPACF